MESANPPAGTYRRIRGRAIWAVAFFASAVPPAIIGSGIAMATPDQANVAIPFAVVFWALGLLFAIWAAFPTLRYWDNLPGSVRWLGALPLLSASLVLSIGIVGSLVA